MTIPSPDQRPLDLVVRGGRVFDRSSQIGVRLDVGVRDGRIAAIEADLSTSISPPKLDYPPTPGTQVIDADGLLVLPGLIDMHAHVYTGVCPLTVDADENCAPAGVTTVVSAGDAGANTIAGFRRLVVERSRTRVLAFVHISTIGLAGWPEGEAHELEYLDVDAAVRAVREHSDFVVGIKVREQAPLIVADHGLEPVRRAVEAGEQAGVPVMVHVGGAPFPLGELAELLRPGDIITHCFTPAGNGLLENGHVSEGVWAARRRGIIFDVGHGYGSFGFEVAEPAAADGFWPDTISTDLHSLSASGPVVDLPTTMSKLLGLGMPPELVLQAVTSRPAEVTGRSDIVGSLEVGRTADLTVMRLDEREVMMRDSSGQTRIGNKAFTVHKTIRAGVPWFGPSPHPGPSSGDVSYVDRRAAQTR